MREEQAIIFVHGLVSSGRGFKGTHFRRVLPQILTPDFAGSLEERMAQLTPILAERTGWVIIGSSLGGLMATLYARRNEQKVRKLILLAPALTYSGFTIEPYPSLAVPTTIFHGKRDALIPLESLRALCEQIFQNLVFNVVDDDHKLERTVLALDWPGLVASE